MEIVSLVVKRRGQSAGQVVKCGVGSGGGCALILDLEGDEAL